MTQCINEILSPKLEKDGFVPCLSETEDGRYEWSFQKGKAYIRLLETFGERIRIDFYVFDRIGNTSKSITKFVPNSTVLDNVGGYEFNNEEEFRELLSRLTPVILNEGINWILGGE